MAKKKVEEKDVLEELFEEQNMAPVLEVESEMSGLSQEELDANVQEPEEPTADEEQSEKPKGINRLTTIREELQKKDLCHTVDEAKARRLELALTDDELNSGKYIALQKAWAELREHGVKKSQLVKAFGGDRGFMPVLSENFQIRYAPGGGRGRYLPVSCLDEGLRELKAKAKES